MNRYTYVFRKSDGRNLGLFVMAQNALGGTTPNRTYIFSLGTSNSEAEKGQLVATWFDEVTVRTSRKDKQFWSDT